MSVGECPLRDLRRAARLLPTAARAEIYPQQDVGVKQRQKLLEIAVATRLEKRFRHFPLAVDVIGDALGGNTATRATREMASRLRVTSLSVTV